MLSLYSEIEELKETMPFNPEPLSNLIKKFSYKSFSWWAIKIVSTLSFLHCLEIKKYLFFLASDWIFEDGFFPVHFSILTPILSARFSPNKSKDMKNSDRTIDYNNIFSLNRIASNETVEGGQSITLGNEFKTLDKSGNEVFSLNLATMFRDEENPDLPKKSTLNRKTSNLVGEILFKPKNFLDLKYNFSLDNDMQTLNYNLIDATFSLNNFVTSFEFLEKNNIIGDESYLANKTTLNITENSSLSFNTRRNKQLGLNEYYDLIYEYKNDCLKAAVEYKKTYYEDGDLKPEEKIYFSLTVIPFGTANTPNLNK